MWRSSTERPAFAHGSGDRNPRRRGRSPDLRPPGSKLRDVYCYFDNTDVKLRARFDAQTLMRKLDLQPGEGLATSHQRAAARDACPAVRARQSASAKGSQFKENVPPRTSAR